MFRQLAFGLGVSLSLSSIAAANGWGSGQNFVPAVRQAIAVDEAGEIAPVERGTPIFIHPEHTEVMTWLRWNERPFERRVQLDCIALPDGLDGFRAYQRGEFYNSADLLESEARAESDTMVQAWKFILAGHSTLLADPSAFDTAVKRYRTAAAVRDNPFQAHAQYFVFRALLHGKRYTQSHEALVALHDQTGDDGFEWSVFFFTYPQHSPLTAWRRRTYDFSGGIDLLGQYIEARDIYRGMDQSTAHDLQAEYTYEFAIATEALWHMYPDSFFDIPQPREAIRLLEETFERFPDTEAAAKAFYRYINNFRVNDGSDADRNEEEIRLMRKFLARFPDSALAPEARGRLHAAEAAAVTEK